jgi:hypothetical protein
MKTHGNRTPKTIKILAMLAVIIFIITGCGTGTSDKTDNTDNTGDTSASDPVTAYDSSVLPDEHYQAVPIYDTEIIEMLNDESISEDYKELLNAPIDYEPLEETAYEKLHNAFETGKISEEEYSKLLILQKYKPESIPGQYCGAEGSEPIDYAYQYIADNWDNLDESTRQLVGPYMFPISDPKSYYFKEDLEGKDVLARSEGKKAFSFISTVNAADMPKQLIMHEFYVDNQKITIEYYEYNNWSEDKKLEYNMCVQDIEDAITQSYGEFEQLLTVSLSKPVRIELVPLEKGTNGEAWYQNGSHRIRLATANYTDVIKTKGTAAHELFHNFQYEMGLRFTGKDMKWLHEATAKWSEHYAFEEYNTEHGYLNYFFATLDRDRINFGKCFEYSGFMLFYYFSDYGRYDIVPEILWGTVRNGESHIRKYLSDEVADMKEQYADYAFKNLNMSIAKQYYDYGDLPGRPMGKAYRSLSMSVDEENIREVSLNPGALQYHYYIFDRDDEIQHVEFEFDKTFENDRYIKRQAMVKIDGEWNLEDWSLVGKVKYCKLRELKNEKIQAVVLIYSNSNFEKDGTDNPVDTFKVTTERCPQEMDIRIEAEYEYKKEDFVWTATATLEDTVKIIDHTFYVSKNCNYKMQGSGVMEGKTVIDTTGSFSGRVDEPTIDNSMVRLIMPMDDGLEEMKKDMEKFGLDENTPKGGILITLPSIQEEGILNGSTTLYMPDPVGKMTLDDPLPFDGLSQAIAVEINKGGWNPKGFSTEMTIDYFSHKPAILDWFKVDFGQLQDMLSSMDAMGGTDIPDINGMLEDSGISLEGLGGLGGLEGLLPENDMGDGDSLTKTLDALMNLAMPSSNGSNGATAVIKLKISGKYTKYN